LQAEKVLMAPLHIAASSDVIEDCAIATAAKSTLLNHIVGGLAGVVRLQSHCWELVARRLTMLWNLRICALYASLADDASEIKDASERLQWAMWIP
jgi:hypothetical protein